MSTTTMSRFAVMCSLLVATTCLAAPAAGQDTRSSANPSAIAVTRSRWIGYNVAQIERSKECEVEIDENHGPRTGIMPRVGADRRGSG